MQKTVDSCHDCSDGGIAVSCSEMCFSGGLGMEINLKNVPAENIKSDEAILFSESNSRFIVEVRKEKEKDFNRILQGANFAKIGQVVKNKKFIVNGLRKKSVIDSDISELKNSWQKTLGNYD